MDLDTKDTHHCKHIRHCSGHAITDETNRVSDQLEFYLIGSDPHTRRFKHKVISLLSDLRWNSEQQHPRHEDETHCNCFWTFALCKEHLLLLVPICRW